jgi:hypothetical protein
MGSNNSTNNTDNTNRTRPMGKTGGFMPPSIGQKLQELYEQDLREAIAAGASQEDISKCQENLENQKRSNDNNIPM